MKLFVTLNITFNINFHHVKGFRDTWRKLIFQGVRTELKKEIYFLRESFTKAFEINLGNQEM